MAFDYPPLGRSTALLIAISCEESNEIKARTRALRKRARQCFETSRRLRVQSKLLSDRIESARRVRRVP